MEGHKLSTVTSSTAQLATFSTGMQQIYVTSNQAMHVSFTGTATSSSFMLPANTPFRFDFRGLNVNSVSCIADSTSGDVYILGASN